jgi:hypothetical protein
VYYGSTVNPTFYVRVGGVLAKNRPVQLCKATGVTFACTTVSTTSAGSVPVRLNVTGSYRIKLVVPATATTTAVTSDVYTVSAQSLARLSRVNATTLTASVTGATGQTVQIQRQTGPATAAWTTWKRYAATPAATITGVSHGYRYRLVVASTATVIGSTSGAVAP